MVLDSLFSVLTKTYGPKRLVVITMTILIFNSRYNLHLKILTRKTFSHTKFEFTRTVNVPHETFMLRVSNGVWVTTSNTHTSFK